MKILYGLTNAQPNYACERVFCPDTDMEQLMLEHQIPLYTLESLEPVADFDLIGFTLQYEMAYTNILNMLHLAGIPLLAADRGNALTPLVLPEDLAFVIQNQLRISLTFSSWARAKKSTWKCLLSMTA